MTSVSTADLAEAVAPRLRELGLAVDSQDDGLRATMPGDGSRQLHLHLHPRPGVASPATVERWRDEDRRRSQATGIDVVTAVAQPHIGVAASRHYQEMGLPHIDAAGNCWVRSWPLVLPVEGRQAVLELTPAPSRPAYAPAGLRLIFTLLVRPDVVEAPIRVQALAAGVSTGSVHDTLAQLATDGFLVRGRTTHLRRVPRLAELWLAGYATRLAPKLRTRRLATPTPTPRWWTPSHLDPAWGAQLGGESALAARGVGLRPATATIYGDPPWDALRSGARLGAPTDDDQAVQLRVRFWHPEHLGTGPLVPDLLTYADAMASPSSRVHEAAATL